MEAISLTLPCSGDKIEVTVTRKRMKNIRLKVYHDYKVAVSIPKGVTDEWIEAYLKEKSHWIEEKLSQYKTDMFCEGADMIENGIFTRILGQDIQVYIEENIVKRVYTWGDRIIIRTPDKMNYKCITGQFETWWREEAKKYYQAILDELYPIVGKHGCKQPLLCIRRMKTLWGSCSIGKDKITINNYLYEAAPSSVEYVILHELSHMIYPKHDKQFYNFLSFHMPDWKDRKKALNHEVVRSKGEFTYFHKPSH